MIETILTRAAELLFNESAVIGFCLGAMPFIGWGVIKMVFRGKKFLSELQNEAAEDERGKERATFVSKINNRW